MERKSFWIEFGVPDVATVRAFERLAETIERLGGHDAKRKVGSGIVLHSTLLFIGAGNDGLDAESIRNALAPVIEKHGPRFFPRGASVHVLGYARVGCHIVLPFLTEDDPNDQEGLCAAPGSHELVLGRSFRSFNPQYRRVNTLACDVFDALTSNNIEIRGDSPHERPWFPHFSVCEFDDNETCIRVMERLSSINFKLAHEIINRPIILGSPVISHREKGKQIKLEILPRDASL